MARVPSGGCGSAGSVGAAAGGPGVSSVSEELELSLLDELLEELLDDVLVVGLDIAVGGRSGSAELPGTAEWSNPAGVLACCGVRLPQERLSACGVVGCLACWRSPGM